jgi:hypothetical protein
MSLIKRAESDLGRIVENPKEFGWPVILKNPEGETLGAEGQTPLYALANDISSLIDPDTGDPVSGRLATVTFRASTLRAAGFKMPKNISDKSSKPWLVTFTNINDRQYTFKVDRSDPDRQRGLLTVYLELYKSGAC